MKYLVTEIQKHKSGAIVIKNTEKTELNGTAGALRLFFDTLSQASVSTSQASCKVQIMDDNMNRIRYGCVVNVEEDEVTPEEPSNNPEVV